MAYLLFDYFHSRSGVIGGNQILGRFWVKISVYGKKTHFHYVKFKKTKYHCNSNRQHNRMPHLLSKYFHLRSDRRGRVKIHEDHISLELKSSKEQNNTLAFQIFLVKSKSSKMLFCGLFWAKTCVYNVKNPFNYVKT